MRFLKIFFTGITFLFFASASLAQDEKKDLKDVIGKLRKDSTNKFSPEIQIAKNYISILPVIGYAPANGFVIGAAVSLSRLFAEAPTNLSSGLVNLQLTSKKQFIINVRSKVYLKDNKWFLQGDWRILYYAQPTYGLGINYMGGNEFLINLNGAETGTSPIEEPMRFNYVRIYEDVVRRIGNGSWYVGLGISLDDHYGIKDEKLNLDSAVGPIYITNHYAYSYKYGFNAEHYITNGFNINVLTDRRDDIANPYRGYFGSVSFRYNPEFMGSAKRSEIILYDLRYYWGLSELRKRNVLAFWTFGNFVTRNDVPYLALPSIGWDTYNRSGRGYIQGRYRGLTMVYTEVEWRYPISRNDLWGGVAFINNTFVSSSTQKLFEKTAPGLGVGLRLTMDKRTRTNLGMDLGYGVDHSSGIYFNLQETF